MGMGFAVLTVLAHAEEELCRGAVIRNLYHLTTVTRYRRYVYQLKLRHCIPLWLPVAAELGAANHQAACFFIESSSRCLPRRGR